jgi:hypothetical protein
MHSILVVLISLVAAVSALPQNTPQNGEVVSTCDGTTDLGFKSCDGTGFITCTHRGNIFRPCAPGTSCIVDPEDDNSIICGTASS